MVVLGIDPGYAIVGYGLVEFKNQKLTPLQYGAIRTAADQPISARLNEIYNDMTHLLDAFQPDCVAMERLYFNTNEKTAINVSQARGVLLLACEQAGKQVFEYTPLQVKMSVVGYGRAEKRQVMELTQRILGLKEIPKPDDAADALAIAVCHAHSAHSQYAR
ncbi:MAG: crossover junction endodeoxyribonuclease RuvC [Ruminococcaceae bacterium]|nr:crossover junction endodeoxyribonuclease RuvC [Oscillospiraceae bacterium]